jgi:ATP-dependent helicase/nuclease subunit A
MSGTVQRLDGNQMLAVAPDETVWLSASAGTGKTHVLVSRVLRLLLQGDVEPSSVLCLTFTKAGAAEMASRIRAELAEWVRLPDPALFARLDAIGAPGDERTKARARTLFAAVLDCPAGGLRIDTIHAFSQWLLAAFPQEAGLLPGTRPMEDRERTMLARQVLADLLVRAEREPLADPQLRDALADLSLRMGPDAVEKWLMACAKARAAWFGKGGWQAADMRTRLLNLLGLPTDLDEAGLAAMCADDAFDVQSLRACMTVNAAWDTKKGREAAATMGEWLAQGEAGRLAGFEALAGVFLTQKGQPKSSTAQEKLDPAYAEYRDRVIACIEAVNERKVLLGLVERLIPALRLGRAFALAWDEAKQREGLIDFDDQIREAAKLLTRSDLADWIRYKLDRRFDHILVDEAQDTNPAQWDIVFALIEEFFAGQGQHGDLMRTLFVVGDYKQAIFRFQGTSPEYFAQARARLSRDLDAAAANAASQRSNLRTPALARLDLGRSFRSSQAVLNFVDAALAEIGHGAFGLAEPADPHIGWRRPGHVSLWQPVVVAALDASEETSDAEEGAGDDGTRDNSGQTWLSRPDRAMADRIARQVADWLDPLGDGFLLAKSGKRAGAGDIMVLVRARRDLAGLIVARLHAHGVPVAGVDRLRIGDPLAVKDVLAALRFAAQPLDDLNLANLLVSPLIGWSQEDLLRLAWRDKRLALWDHLRAATNPDAANAMAMLRDLLSRADFETPQMLISWLLSGPWQARRKLVARLGQEANDPLDELLNAAHAYCAAATASLVGFLQWFDAGEGELKREADNAGDLVRVMTVHGAKGLQAPIVILADATSKPGGLGADTMLLPDPAAPETRAIPLPAPRKEERLGTLAAHHAAEQAAELEEHWRLLYVAMTRAEEALFIGGALGSRDKGEAPADSWYARLRGLFRSEEQVDDPIWTTRYPWGDPVQDAGPLVTARQLPLGEVVPPWLQRAPLAEPRPPRPLAPSALEAESLADPPTPRGSSGPAARRGVLIHKLLERLPDLDQAARTAAGEAWLARHAADFPAGERDEMLASALAVLAVPEWAGLFAPGSLAEVPITATLGTQVIAGTIDRLLVEEHRVLVVDYKTARRPPASLDEVPGPILRQMAAYCAALEKVWPGRAIEAALLYTAVPGLMPIPADVIARHKPGLVLAQ